MNQKHAPFLLSWISLLLRGLEDYLASILLIECNEMLFIDEIGDIPLELQPKLLRELQEGEFERLGSTQTQHVDFRVVAATNADLWRLMSEKRFRSDLYYRLNAFTFPRPLLRNRGEDIPGLGRHFVAKEMRDVLAAHF